MEVRKKSQLISTVQTMFMVWLHYPLALLLMLLRVPPVMFTVALLTLPAARRSILPPEFALSLSGVWSRIWDSDSGRRPADPLKF